MNVTKEFNGDKRELTFKGVNFQEFKETSERVSFDAVLVPDASIVPVSHFNGTMTFAQVPAKPVEALDLVWLFFGSPKEVSATLNQLVAPYMQTLRGFVRAHNMHFAPRMFEFQAPGYDGCAEAVVIRIFRDEDSECIEHPEMLTGQPIGMYHCPYCAHMQVAGHGHTVDEELV